jgi:hypothetical protein
MKLRITDPGAKDYTAFLDGKPLRRWRMADEENGEVVCFKEDKKGTLLLQAGLPVPETLHGVVNLISARRVGAIRDANETTVHMFGYGFYVGDELPPKEVMELTLPNPKIILDNGDVIWGCQCWWSNEAKVQEIIGDREVVIVPIPSVN